MILFSSGEGCFLKNNLRNRMVSLIFETDWLRNMRRDVFQAIADPTRREIINMIAHETMNLNSVAEKFNVSRPAISKHIRILTECGLITIKQRGRERYCEAKLDQLNQVSEWVEKYRVFWTQKLDALGTFLEQETTTTSSTNKSTKK
jgi:DNA-binding transcriptional ArsR family regulator